jgi:D-lactate dehydrogenase
MGCEVLAYDLFQSKEAIEMGVTYVDTVEELLPKCQIVTLHCPLMDDTYHLMNDEKFNLMKRGSMLVNTSRGGLVDTAALGRALDTQKIACVGMDVYEHEAGLFFEDKSEETDATPGSSLSPDWDLGLSALASRPNVLVTSHQAFLTAEALGNIAATTVDNLMEFAGGGGGGEGGKYVNEVVGH